MGLLAVGSSLQVLKTTKVCKKQARVLHSEDNDRLFSSPHVTKMIESWRIMRWAYHVAGKRAKVSLVGKLDGRHHLKEVGSDFKLLLK